MAAVAATMIVVSSTSGQAYTQTDRNEQRRYVNETVHLTYTAFIKRKADFVAAGCKQENHLYFGQPTVGCRKPSPYNAFDWTSDGCSWTPPPYKYLFDQPCQQHDFGYRNFGNGGLQLDRTEDRRHDIDSQFLSEMRRVCNAKYRFLPKALAACHSTALTMFGVVRNGTNWSTPGPYYVPVTTPVPAPGPAPGPAPTYSEQQGSHGVNTFTNYHNASGLGSRIDAAQWVQVSCKVYDPYIVSANPDGYWYRIASSPWDNQFYSPANTFMNGDPWGGPYSHNTDFAVPDC